MALLRSSSKASSASRIRKFAGSAASSFRRVRRGFSKPSKGEAARYAELIEKKLAGISFNSVVGVGKQRTRSERMPGIKQFIKALPEIEGRQAKEKGLIVARIAAKYALDAANVSDGSSRQFVQGKIAKMMANLEKWDSVNTKFNIAKGTMNEIADKIGRVKTTIFLKRFNRVRDKFRKEIVG